VEDVVEHVEIVQQLEVLEDEADRADSKRPPAGIAQHEGGKAVGHPAVRLRSGSLHLQFLNSAVRRRVRRKNTTLDIAIEAGIRPVRDTGNMPMFDGVVRNVVQVRFEVPFIANRVLPESPLPDGALPVLDTAYGTPLALGNASREPCLDIVPPCREIAVARGKRPDAVQMIREDDDGVDLEGPAPPGIGKHRPQVAAAHIDQAMARMLKDSAESGIASRLS
jgi:hypothetical protein